MQGLQVDGLARHAGEVRGRVKVGHVGPDHIPHPHLKGEFLAVFGINGFPGFDLGRFGIHDEAVEIENQCFDHDPPELQLAHYNRDLRAPEWAFSEMK